MKRIYTYIIYLMCMCCLATAQTQQGIVKTRGREVNGQIVAGVRLSDATITLNFGNSLVSGSQGEFSFNVPIGKAYSLVMAEKNGYTLADPEYTRCSFMYSASNPFYVVLEDVNQRQADINAATRKVRRTLMAQLQAREDEIEALKEQNKLSEDEYQKRLQELYDNQSKCEQLVKEMAERYASTDYDQLDEFNRQVQMFIEEGELQKADSLIRSKGDMEKRISDYHRAVSVNIQVRNQLEKSQQALQQSESGTRKTYEDLSRDLLSRSVIFFQEFKHDSALYCLKMRANLDTTILSTVVDYAFICYHQKKFLECEKYYLICLRSYLFKKNIPAIVGIENALGLLYHDLHDYAISEKYLKLALEHLEQLFQQNSDVYRADLAMIQNNLGLLYHDLHDYSNSEKYYKSALEHYEQLYSQNPEAYRADLAITRNNLGSLYRSLHDYSNSEKYYKSALENYEQLSFQNPDAYREDLAGAQNNLGVLYYVLHDYFNSEKYYKSALENYEQLFLQNPDAYRYDIAQTLNNLGALYHDLHDYAISEKYLKIALEHREQLFQQNPNVYRADLAMNLYNLGILHRALHDYSNSEKYLKLALEHREQLFQQNPEAYRADLAITWNKLGSLYRSLHDYSNSEKYLKLALEHQEQLFQQNPEAYRADLAITWNNLGSLYCSLHDYFNSEKYYKSALENYEQLFLQNPDAYRYDIAQTLHNLGALYSSLQDYASSEKYLKLALEHYEQLYSLNPEEYLEDLANTQNTLGILYKALHDYSNSERYYKSALEHYEQLFLHNSDAYRAGLAMTQNNLGILYSSIHDYASSEKYYKSALEHREQLFQQNPDDYREKLATTCWNVMLQYEEMNDLEQYDLYLDKSLSLYTDLYKLQPPVFRSDVIELQNRKVWRLLGNGSINEAMKLAEATCAMDELNEQSQDYLAECYNGKSYEYAKACDFDNAHGFINKALLLVPDVANFYDTKGEIFLMEGKNEEALKMWKKVLEIEPNFMKEHPTGTNLSNGLKKLGLIK